MGNVEKLSLCELYNILLAKNTIPKNIWPQILYSYDDNDIYRKINEYYALENNDSKDISNYEDIRILFAYARRKSRYELLSEYIKTTIAKVLYNGDYADLFTFNNVDQLFGDIFDEVRMYEEQFSGINGQLSKISKGKTIEIVKKILVSIDPSLEWLNIYSNMIKKNRIIYINELSDNERKKLRNKYGLNEIRLSDNSFIATKEDGNYLLLDYKGNIKDVINTLHEFIHYVMFLNGNFDISFMFEEFLSIFYELYAIDYLMNLGYSKMEGLLIFKERIMNAISVDKESFILRKCALFQLNNKLIDREMFIEFIKEAINNFNIIILINDEEVIIGSKNALEYADTLCDILLEKLIMNPDIFEKVGRYVIGTYLALWARESMKNDDRVLDIIKNYVDNIKDINPYDVFLKMGVPVNSIKLVDVGRNYLRRVRRKDDL